MKWDTEWVYTDDELPPDPLRPSRPRIITFESRTGERSSAIGIYMGKGKWKLHHGESSYRVIAWRELPSPALG